MRSNLRHRTRAFRKTPLSNLSKTLRVPSFSSVSISNANFYFYSYLQHSSSQKFSSFGSSRKSLPPLFPLYCPILQMRIDSEERSEIKNYKLTDKNQINLQHTITTNSHPDGHPPTGY
ncbi:hypothetical protein ACOME3_003326 [Neoechinorhynchus agilis]